MLPKTKQCDRDAIEAELNADAEDAEADAELLKSYLDEEDDWDDDDLEEAGVHVEDDFDPNEEVLNLTGDDFFDEETFVQAVETQVEADRRDLIIGGFNTDAQEDFTTFEAYQDAVQEFEPLTDEESVRVRNRLTALYDQERTQARAAAAARWGDLNDASPVFYELTMQRGNPLLEAH